MKTYPRQCIAGICPFISSGSGTTLFSKFILQHIIPGSCGGQ